MTIGDFTELRLNLDEEWETPIEAPEQAPPALDGDLPITVEREYTPLELVVIEEMRKRRDERREA